MKKVILIIIACTFFLSGCSHLGKLSDKEIGEIINKGLKAKIYVVDIYHDKCETCKQIEPTVRKLKEYYEGNNAVVFLWYNLSNPFTLYDSMKIAKALGLEDIYKAQRYSGVVLIIDAKTKKVLDTIIAEPDIKQYATIIKKWLESNAT